MTDRPDPIVCRTVQLRVLCPVCGKKKVTYHKVEKTVSPAYKTADGRPKTRAEVSQDVENALALWVEKAKRDGTTCRECAWNTWNLDSSGAS